MNKFQNHLQMKIIYIDKAQAFSNTKYKRERKMFHLTSQHRLAFDSGPQSYVSSERQGWHREQKIWK